MAETTGPVLDDNARRAHERLLHDSGLQHQLTDAPVRTPDPPPSDSGPWHLDGLSEAATWLFYGALALLAVIIVYMVVRSARDYRRPARATPLPGEAATEQAAIVARNIALLAEADALAARGDFDAAVHALLLQGVQDIGQRYPSLLRPAYTSRVIARLEGLPQQMRDVYSRIADAVERSRFGGRPIDRSAYAECRAAYAAWAVPT